MGTALEEEEANEQAKLERLKERQRQKKNRQRERQRAQKQSGKPDVTPEVRGHDRESNPVRVDDDDGPEIPEVSSTIAVEGSAALKVHVASTEIGAGLGCDALRAKIAQAQREKTRIARQL